MNVGVRHAPPKSLIPDPTFRGLLTAIPEHPVLYHSPWATPSTPIAPDPCVPQTPDPRRLWPSLSRHLGPSKTTGPSRVRPHPGMLEPGVWGTPIRAPALPHLPNHRLCTPQGHTSPKEKPSPLPPFPWSPPSSCGRPSYLWPFHPSKQIWPLRPAAPFAPSALALLWLPRAQLLRSLEPQAPLPWPYSVPLAHGVDPGAGQAWCHPHPHPVSPACFPKFLLNLTPVLLLNLHFPPDPGPWGHHLPCCPLSLPGRARPLSCSPRGVPTLPPSAIKYESCGQPAPGGPPLAPSLHSSRNPGTPPLVGFLAAYARSHPGGPGGGLEEGSVYRDWTGPSSI